MHVAIRQNSSKDHNIATAVRLMDDIGNLQSRRDMCVPNAASQLRFGTRISQAKGPLLDPHGIGGEASKPRLIPSPRIDVTLSSCSTGIALEDEDESRPNMLSRK